MPDVRIVVYGMSLLLAVVEAALKRQPSLSLTRIDPASPQAAVMLQALQPHIVLVDGTQDFSALSSETVLRLAWDATRQVAIINNCTYSILHSEQLVNAIHQALRDETTSADL